MMRNMMTNPSDEPIMMGKTRSVEKRKESENWKYKQKLHRRLWTAGIAYSAGAVQFVDRQIEIDTWPWPHNCRGMNGPQV